MSGLANYCTSSYTAKKVHVFAETFLVLNFQWRTYKKINFN